MPQWVELVRHIFFQASLFSSDSMSPLLPKWHLKNCHFLFERKKTRETLRQLLVFKGFQAKQLMREIFLFINRKEGNLVTIVLFKIRPLDQIFARENCFWCSKMIYHGELNVQEHLSKYSVIGQCTQQFGPDSRDISSGLVQFNKPLDQMSSKS